MQELKDIFEINLESWNFTSGNRMQNIHCYECPKEKTSIPVSISLD